MDLGGQLSCGRQDQGPNSTGGAGPHPAIRGDQETQRLAGTRPEGTLGKPHGNPWGDVGDRIPWGLC